MSDQDAGYVIAPPPIVSIAVVARAARFPVRRIYCVGRNYLDHIREMGGDEREPPFFFQKPTDAIVEAGATIDYPQVTEDFQHEVELVLAVGRGGRDIAQADAAAHVFGLAVGIDLTRRDLQIKARNAGRPWEVGKAFDRSAPISAIAPLEGTLPARGAISLSVNGEVRQSGDLSQMIWSCAEVVANLSTQYELQAGDLIYTGTPSGVGPIVSGDRIEARIDGLAELKLSIA